MSLVIRNEQIESLEQSLTDKFIERLAAELRADQTADVEPYTDEELHQGIAEGIERAESYGLESDADVAAFVKLLFGIGWYFDRYPMFQEILTGDLYEHYEKMTYLFKSATDEDWEKAADDSDEESRRRENQIAF